MGRRCAVQLLVAKYQRKTEHTLNMTGNVPAHDRRTSCSILVQKTKCQPESRSILSNACGRFIPRFWGNDAEYNAGNVWACRRSVTASSMSVGEPLGTNMRRPSSIIGPGLCVIIYEPSTGSVSVSCRTCWRKDLAHRTLRRPPPGPLVPAICPFRSKWTLESQIRDCCLCRLLCRC